MRHRGTQNDLEAALTRDTSRFVGSCDRCGAVRRGRDHAGRVSRGAFKSPLATPAVDEVVSAKPLRVLVLTCVATPPGKVLQFETELKARHNAALAIALSDKHCVSA